MGAGDALLRLTGEVMLWYALLRGTLDMKLFSYEYLGFMCLALGLLYAQPRRRSGAEKRGEALHAFP